MLRLEATNNYSLPVSDAEVRRYMAKLEPLRKIRSQNSSGGTFPLLRAKLPKYRRLIGASFRCFTTCFVTYYIIFRFNLAENSSKQ